MLGAHLLIERGDLIPTIKRVAAERGTTYVLVGQPLQRGILHRWREPLPLRLIEALPGIDIRMVADRTRRRPAGGEDGR